MPFPTNLAYGVESALLKSNLDIRMSAVGVTTSLDKLINFPPTVRSLWYGSSLCGE